MKKKMMRFMTAVLTAGLMLGLTACGNGSTAAAPAAEQEASAAEQETPAGEETTSDQKYRIGLSMGSMQTDFTVKLAAEVQAAVDADENADDHDNRTQQGKQTLPLGDLHHSVHK